MLTYCWVGSCALPWPDLFRPTVSTCLGLTHDRILRSGHPAFSVGSHPRFTNSLSWPIVGLPTALLHADASRTVLSPTHWLRLPPSWSFGQSRGRQMRIVQRMDQRHRLYLSATVRPRASMSHFIRAADGLFAPFHPVNQLPGVTLAEGRGTAARSSIHW